MAYWIKKFARIVGIASFFAVFLATLDWAEPLAAHSIGVAFLKGVAAMALFWFVGFIMGDIIFKTVVEDIAAKEDDELEGGILQRALETKEAGPFGKQMPVESAAAQEITEAVPKETAKGPAKGTGKASAKQPAAKPARGKS